jgi:hypothetical protein
MISEAKCHGCGEVISRHHGCPGRIVICPECRKKPKLLQEARKAMELHLFEHVEVKGVRSKTKARGTLVRNGDGIRVANA